MTKAQKAIAELPFDREVSFARENEDPSLCFCTTLGRARAPELLTENEHRSDDATQRSGSRPRGNRRVYGWPLESDTRSPRLTPCCPSVLCSRRCKRVKPSRAGGPASFGKPYVTYDFPLGNFVNSNSLETVSSFGKEKFVRSRKKSRKSNRYRIKKYICIPMSLTLD